MSTTNTTSTNLCLNLSSPTNTTITLSKRTLILTFALCATLTLLSLAATSLLLHRELTRRRQSRAAATWGRKSRYIRRVSLLTKEVDSEYRQKYTGCLQHVPENPELGSESPVEMGGEERLCEVPAAPVKAVKVGGRRSLWFDEGVGMWLPKR